MLEILSKRLLGRMSGIFLNLGMNDLSHACMCCVKMLFANLSQDR